MPPSHQPVAIVLDFMNPVGAGRRLIGRTGEAGFDEARPVSRQALTHNLNRHGAKIGSVWAEGESSEPPVRCTIIRWRSALGVQPPPIHRSSVEASGSRHAPGAFPLLRNTKGATMPPRHPNDDENDEPEIEEEEDEDRKDDDPAVIREPDEDE
jgi:hypothetical protein